jgi:hypothetical protein
MFFSVALMDIHPIAFRVCRSPPFEEQAPYILCHVYRMVVKVDTVGCYA